MTRVEHLLTMFGGAYSECPCWQACLTWTTDDNCCVAASDDCHGGGSWWAIAFGRSWSGAICTRGSTHDTFLGVMISGNIVLRVQLLYIQVGSH